MACYSTVGEQPQSRVGRQGLANRQDSNLSFGSISTLPWKRESILNLATAGDRQSWKHSLLDPSHKSFRPEADCQLHYECNDPISRYSILIEQAFIAPHTIALRCFALKTLAEDLASQTPEYRWKYFVECNICQKKREEYEEVAASVEHFATSILGQCRNSQEVTFLCCLEIFSRWRLSYKTSVRVEAKTQPIQS